MRPSICISGLLSALTLLGSVHASALLDHGAPPRASDVSTMTSDVNKAEAQSQIRRRSTPPKPKKPYNVEDVRGERGAMYRKIQGVVEAEGLNTEPETNEKWTRYVQAIERGQVELASRLLKIGFKDPKMIHDQLTHLRLEFGGTGSRSEPVHPNYANRIGLRPLEDHSTYEGTYPSEGTLTPEQRDSLVEHVQAAYRSGLSKEEAGAIIVKAVKGIELPEAI